MNCSVCGAAAWLRVRTGSGTLVLCRACALCYERRTLGVSLSRWLQQLIPPPKTYTQCPFCGTTAEQVQQTGLYGCCLCYQVLAGKAPPSEGL
ncbi:MAG: hypothetical protein ABDI19_12235 [Armatimonadota bacterium]